MSYPILPQAYSSSESSQSGRQTDRASNGSLRGRDLFTTPKKTFTVQHEFVSNANKLALLAFKAANPSAPFDFIWDGDGATYSCTFGDKDIQCKPGPGSLWDITVHLEQV